MREASEWVSKIWRGWGERMMWVRGGVNGGETVLRGSSERGKSWGEWGGMKQQERSE